MKLPEGDTTAISGETVYSQEMVLRLLQAERARCVALCDKTANRYGYEEDTVSVPGVLEVLADDIRNGDLP